MCMSGYKSRMGARFGAWCFGAKLDDVGSSVLSTFECFHKLGVVKVCLKIGLIFLLEVYEL